MIVKCVKIVSPATLKEVPEHPSIAVGACYEVFSIEISTDGRARFRIVGNEWDTPALWNSEMFDIVDGAMPDSWTAVGANGSFSLGPAAVAEPGFWERYFDREPEAVAIYRRELGPLIEGRRTS